MIKLSEKEKDVKTYLSDIANGSADRAHAQRVSKKLETWDGRDMNAHRGEHVKDSQGRIGTIRIAFHKKYAVNYNDGAHGLITENQRRDFTARYNEAEG
jgi:hypothetical protein